MVLRIIEKDILTVEKGIICHQVNCMGVMGAGVALQIAQKWPKVLEEYQEYCEDNQYTCLGDWLDYAVTPNLFIANLFGQDSFGEGKQTQYWALSQALRNLKLGFYEGGFFPNIKSDEIYFPYLIGCGLGGGKWEVVSELIEEQFPNATICKLP